MKYEEIISYALGSLRYRKIRSWLTILGIIVGITAVVVLVGLAQGLKDQVNSQLQGFGPRTVVIAPYNIEGGSSSFLGGAGSANLRPSSGKLYEKDVERISRISAIDSIAKIIMGRTILSFKGEEITGSVYAIEPDAFKQTTMVEIEQGRFIETGDKGVAVIGNDISQTAFKKIIDVGSVMDIGGRSYQVIGVLKKTGNSFSQVDNVIFVQFEEGKDLFSAQLIHDEISTIRLIIKEGYLVKEVADEIEQTLLSSHKLTADKKDFTLVTPEFINQQVDGITGMLTAFLGGIAAISLFIGGIGISNTMFMSVLERRREIGILKSIGATELEIRNLFVIESALIGFFGGIAGIMLGWVLISLISIVANFPAAFTLPISLGALSFSVIVGVIAGAIPASQAARLDPIEALRY